MIINVRGTSGSGKSHLVRRVMEHYQQLPVRQQINGKDRKQPVGYLCTRDDAGRSLYVLGHYATACGGCDTLPTLDYVYDAVRMAAVQGHDVLFEGVIVTSDVARCIALHKDYEHVLVLGMSTPLEQCVAGIQSRRDARGDERELNPKNTVAKMKTNVVGMRKLQEAGVNALWADRETAYRTACEALGLAP